MVFDINSDDGNRTTSRRGVLSGLTSVVGLAIVPSTLSAAGSGPDRSVSPDTSKFEHLDDVTVDIYEDARVDVTMAGTSSQEAATAGYRVNVRSPQAGSRSPAPEDVSITLTRVPPEELPEVSNEGAQRRSLDEAGRSAGAGSDPSTDDVVLLDHGDQNDKESDYEGGCWMRGENSFDETHCKTNNWASWSAEDGNVDTLYRSLDAIPVASSWEVDDSWYESSDFSGSDAESPIGARYSNDNYGHEWNHRSTVSCNPDGSMDWWTAHSYSGFYGGRVDAGHYSSW